MCRVGWGLLVILAAARAAAAPVPPPRPQLDPKVAAAWKKAGFSLRWVYDYNDSGHPRATFDRPKTGLALPLLTWGRWRAGVLPKLPSPDVPFALSLYNGFIPFDGITDAGLKHLEGMQQPGYLHVQGTKVTYEALYRLREVIPKLRFAAGK
jgi:hypothetical protein